MQVDTQILQEQQLVIDNITGEVTVDELREKFGSLFSNPDYDESMCGICDFRNATSRMNREDFEHLADELDENSDFGHTRWAIVTNDPMLTAFAQIFQRRVGDAGKIKVFSTLEAAAIYLNRPVESLLGKV